MEASQMLSSVGIKCTKQRIAIADILQKEHLPLTAEEIFLKTSEMSLSTIYRALELFTEKGIVEKESIHNSSEFYYRLCSNSHFHYAICLNCHKMSSIDVCPIHNTNIDNFTVTGHKLEFYGYCKNCAEKIKNK